ncbi:MAG: hypothetical protein ACI4UX_01380 [Clostridia bacterium]
MNYKGYFVDNKGNRYYPQKNILIAKISSNYEIQNSNNVESIKNFIEYNKTGTKLSVVDGVIKIGAGINKVKVNYHATSQATVDSTRCFTYLNHKKSSGNVLISQESHYYSDKGNQVSVDFSTLEDVEEGDEFYINCYGRAGNRIMRRNIIFMDNYYG